LNIGLCFLFSAWFSQIGWMPLGGLALSISLSTAIETTTLFFLLRKRLKGIQGRELALGMGAAVLGTLAMSIVILFWLQGTKNLSPALMTLGGVVVGAGSYALAMLVLRVPEVGSLIRMARRLLKR
jgi:putative peptidoglycan lipid II flippase